MRLHKLVSTREISRHECNLALPNKDAHALQTTTHIWNLVVIADGLGYLRTRIKLLAPCVFASFRDIGLAY